MPAQVAALAAMDCRDELDANLAVYAENRQLMMEGLPKAGFTNIAPPDGAFYVYADVSDQTDDSLAFAGRILEEAGRCRDAGAGFRSGQGGRDVAVFLCPGHGRYRGRTGTVTGFHGAAGVARSRRGTSCYGFDAIRDQSQAASTMISTLSSGRASFAVAAGAGRARGLPGPHAYFRRPRSAAKSLDIRKPDGCAQHLFAR